MKVLHMTSNSATEKGSPPRSDRTPTEYLTGEKIEQLTQLSIYRLAREGFALEDVKSMISISELYSSAKVLKRIVRKPGRSSQPHSVEQSLPRLSAHQSAVAFQFAKVLEHATTVFGSQQFAEDWLDRPCKYLGEISPLDMIDNALGFQAVEDYLERVELGVYQ